MIQCGAIAPLNDCIMIYLLAYTRPGERKWVIAGKHYWLSNQCPPAPLMWRRVDQMRSYRVALAMWFTVDSRKSCSDAESLLNEWVHVHQLQGLSAFRQPHYLPEAFWNNHLTVNKTLIQICCSAGKYHLRTPMCVNMHWSQHIVKL